MRYIPVTLYIFYFVLSHQVYGLPSTPDNQGDQNSNGSNSKGNSSSTIGNSTPTNSNTPSSSETSKKSNQPNGSDSQPSSQPHPVTESKNPGTYSQSESQTSQQVQQLTSVGLITDKPPDGTEVEPRQSVLESIPRYGDHYSSSLKRKPAYEGEMVHVRSALLRVMRVKTLHHEFSSDEVVPQFVNTRVLFFSHNLQIITEDDNLRLINDETKFDKIAGFDGYVYAMKDGTKCVEVDYLDTNVWKMKQDSTNYPDIVEFNVIDPPCIIIGFPDESLIYRYINSQWRLMSGLTTETAPFDQSKIKIVTSIDAFGSGSISNDQSRYDIKQEPELKLFYYDFHKNSYCIGVNYENANVWVHSRPDYGFDFPVRVYFHVDFKQVAIQFETFYLIYKYADGWKYQRKVYTRHFDSRDIQIISYDPDHYGKITINDVRQYDYINHYYLLQYKFKPRSKCLVIKYKNDVVWLRHHLFGDHYPRSIHYNHETECFFIDFDSRWFYVYKFDDNYRRWNLRYKDETNKPSDLPCIGGKLLHAIVTDAPPEAKEEKVKPSGYRSYEVPYTLVLEKPEEELPVFEDRADFSKVFYISHKYNREGKISELYCNNSRIWEKIGFIDDPKSITFASNILTFSININRGDFFIYKYNGVDWVRFKAPSKGVIDLDIYKRESTDTYYFSSEGNVDTYLTLSEFYFTKIVYGGTYTRGTYNSYIWKARGPLEYSEKVVVDRHGRLNYDLDITVYYLNGCEATFHIGGLHGTFSKFKWSETSSSIGHNIIITTSDDDQGTNRKENDISKFDIYTYLRRETPSSDLVGIYMYVCKFRETSICLSVERGTEKIWEYEGGTQSFPQKITFDLDKNNYYFEFRDKTLNLNIQSAAIKPDLSFSRAYD